MPAGHGGSRPGAGKKRKPMAEKILEGNPGKRKLTVVEFSEPDDLEAVNMPPPHDFLSEEQRNAKPFLASMVYEETWQWLHERSVDHLIPPQLIETYAVAVARWIQCERAVTEFGFLSKHPTTGNPMTSPYIAIAQSYLKLVNTIWYQVYQTIRENSSTEIKGKSPHDDIMERILSGKS